MSDIALQPAHALAEAIRRRDVSSRELLEHYLARVDALNRPLNAVVTLDPDSARAAADAADASLARGDDVGPLHGVPMTVKDTYLTARACERHAGCPPGTTCPSTTPRRSGGCAARAR